MEIPRDLQRCDHCKFGPLSDVAGDGLAVAITLVTTRYFRASSTSYFLDLSISLKGFVSIFIRTSGSPWRKTSKEHFFCFRVSNTSLLFRHQHIFLFRKLEMKKKKQENQKLPWSRCASRAQWAQKLKNNINLIIEVKVKDPDHYHFSLMYAKSL